MSTTDQTVTIPGPVGDLEARLRGARDQAPLSVLLCHPHPLFGGTLHNKTLFRIAKRLAEEGIPSLRFNFRGAGQSAGTHDQGRGELDDARAALEWMVGNAPAERYALVGYSFGAVVGLRVGNEDPRIGAMVGLGLPMGRDWDLGYLDDLAKPLCLVHGQRDEFGDGDQLRAFAATLPGAVTVRIVPDANHLFVGQEDEAVAHTVDFLRAQLP